MYLVCVEFGEWLPNFVPLTIVKMSRHRILLKCNFKMSHTIIFCIIGNANVTPVVIFFLINHLVASLHVCSPAGHNTLFPCLIVASKRYKNLKFDTYMVCHKMRIVMLLVLICAPTNYYKISLKALEIEAKIYFRLRRYLPA